MSIAPRIIRIQLMLRLRFRVNTSTLNLVATQQVDDECDDADAHRAHGFSQRTWIERLPLCSPSSASAGLASHLSQQTLIFVGQKLHG